MLAISHLSYLKSFQTKMNALRTMEAVSTFVEIRLDLTIALVIKVNETGSGNDSLEVNPFLG